MPQPQGPLMPRFRPALPAAAAAEPVSLPAARELIAEVLRPGHFFVGRTIALEWEPASAETVFWEVFQGRLLDPPLTRLRRPFEAWNVFLVEEGVRSAEPVLSVKLDAEAGQ